MRGHVTKRSGDTWSVVISLGRDPKTGKYLQKWFTVQGTKKEAEAFMIEAINRFNSLNYVEPSKYLYADFLDKWLDYCKDTIRPTTHHWYKMNVESYIKPALGQVFITRLSPLHLQKFYKDMLESGRRNPHSNVQSLSPATVRGLHRTIRRSLEVALKWGIVTRNVAALVDKPKQEVRQYPILSVEQSKAFLKLAESSRYYGVYLTALSTGMRIGEILGLRWSDIDFDSHLINVRQILKESGSKPVFTPVKTKHSYRQIYMMNELYNALKKIKAEQAKERLAAGEYYMDLNLVFAISLGHPFTPKLIRERDFNRIIARLGYPRMRFHDLRHSFASILLAAGVHPKIVSEMLGHSSIGITMDTYSHVIPRIQKDALDGLDGRLFGNCD